MKPYTDYEKWLLAWYDVNTDRSRESIETCYSNVLKFAEKNGFWMEGTGGGCLAWNCLINKSRYFMLTDLDSSIAIFPDEDCYFGVYDDEGEMLSCIQINFGDFMEIW